METANGARLHSTFFREKEKEYISPAMVSDVTRTSILPLCSVHLPVVASSALLEERVSDDEAVTLRSIRPATVTLELAFKGTLVTNVTEIVFSLLGYGLFCVTFATTKYGVYTFKGAASP